MPRSDFLSFVPYLRPTLWGGDRLQRYGKAVTSGSAIGESWEVSGHAIHVSRVGDGSPSGRFLTELWAVHASEWTAGEYLPEERFPLLVKLLDCRLPCSVQVHPQEPSTTARHHHAKTEAWTVLETLPGAKVYAGLKASVSEADLRSALEAGTVLDCLNAVEPKVGDCFLITPGTVHTMQGVVLAEIQTSSDATFRLYDWNRLDRDGQRRVIHVEVSLASIDWTRGPVAPVPRRLLEAVDGMTSESLVDISEFQLTRHTLNGRWSAPSSDTFSIWMLTHGEATLSAADGRSSRHIAAGDTLLIPPHEGIQFVSSGESPAVLLQCRIGT